MVKNWEMAIKHDFFLELIKNLEAGKSSVPSIRLFKGLLKDQKDRYAYNSSPTKQTGDEDTKTEITLAQSVSILIKEFNLPTILLNNLRDYSAQVNTLLTKSHDQELRKKLFVVNQKYSHQEEIDERLTFLRYISQISTDYSISKLELEVLYELLVKDSKIHSDQDEFLTWCKSSCEQSTSTIQILDLNEVGEFFTEKMKNGELDVRNLLVVGFEFL